MASIQKTAKGYRAQIYYKGKRSSKTFITKRDAVAWANAQELALKDDRPGGAKYTLADAFDKYEKEVSPKKRGENWEIRRFNVFRKSILPLDKKLSDVTTSDLALYRDHRLKTVKTSTVNRDLSLISSVFEVARLEWKWVVVNPCQDLKRPAPPKHRERTILWWEIKRMLRVMKYSPNLPTNKTQSVANCFLLALATGMRASELCNLTWANVHDDYVHLLITKNSASRDVPLSRKAKRVINRMRGYHEEKVFGLNSASLDALFRKYRKMASLDGFTFHDSRHSAATMLAKKVDALTLCKIMGWRDPKFALVYYNPTASDIAARLG